MVYNYLYNLVYYNMVLRIFLEGYMQYALTSMINVRTVRNTRGGFILSLASLAELD